MKNIRTETLYYRIVQEGPVENQQPLSMRNGRNYRLKRANTSYCILESIFEVYLNFEVFLKYT